MQRAVMARESHEGELTGRTDMEKWKAPFAGRLKANWYATLNIKGERMGMGVVIRDHAGCVKAVRYSSSLQTRKI